MTLFIIAFLAGMLTIISPCILPVLPFVFARAGLPFWRGALPMLLAMAVSFAAVASLAALGGGWAVQANEFGRYAAMALLGVFGLMLLFPGFSAWLSRPAVALGARLSRNAESNGGIAGSLLLGIATGFLWAPCAGPVLGLILTGAALNGASIGTTALLGGYALGAATSLALLLAFGGRLARAMRRWLGLGDWLRRGAGAAVIAAVVAIFFGVDTGLLTRLSVESTAALEQGLIDRLDANADAGGRMAMSPDDPAMMQSGPAMMESGPAMMQADPAMMMQAEPGMMMQGGGAAGDSGAGQAAVPALRGAVEWLNSPPLSLEGLKGKVVLVDFWTYSCINCLRAIPYVRAWAEKYRDRGLVVVGVHSPEFAFEKRIANVRRAIGDLQIDYPVAVDNDYAIWRSFENRYWPAHYFFDAEGRLRHRQFGEGSYEASERMIQTLLAEAGMEDMPGGVVSVSADGAQAAADLAGIQSPETYLGYLRAQNFINANEMAPDEAHDYAGGATALNQWGLSGRWKIGPEKAELVAAEGAIAFRFRARDLHLVLGAGEGGRPVRFRVTIDGKPPGEDHGVDSDSQGNGVVTEERLYQLVRQKSGAGERLFEIRFLDAGAEAYAFTFG